jgi:hypothetical protein
VAVIPDASTTLDVLLPEYEYRTLQGRAVHAPLDRVAAAIRSTSIGEARIAQTLFAIRSGGRSLRRRERLIADVGDGEDGFVRIADLPYEVVAGFAGRPWPGGDQTGMPETAEAWRALVPVDTVKVAMSIRCLEADYGTLLVTETRIQCGAQALEPFGRYWILIRAGSALVRHSLLRAIAREAGG